MGLLSQLLDEMGITDPKQRAWMKRVVVSEMSMDFEAFKRRGGKTHTLAQCKQTRKQSGLTNCVVHNPSKHVLSGQPQTLRSTGLIEDRCNHGQGHPNPDSVAYMNWKDGYTAIGQDYADRYGWGVHGCDGCCKETR